MVHVAATAALILALALDKKLFGEREELTRRDSVQALDCARR